mgnify:CR=1 FL=1|jgi:hypothetical protein
MLNLKLEFLFELYHKFKVILQLFKLFNMMLLKIIVGFFYIVILFAKMAFIVIVIF